MPEILPRVLPVLQAPLVVMRISGLKTGVLTPCVTGFGARVAVASTQTTKRNNLEYTWKVGFSPVGPQADAGA